MRLIRRDRRWLVAAGTALGLLLAAGVFGLWRWGPFANDHPDVPSCTEMVARLPATAGGAWSVRRPEPTPRASTSASSCELSFTSADQRINGTVSVLVIGSTDVEQMRRDVSTGPCYGVVEPVATTGGYLALKRCAEVIGDLVRAGMFAARDNRFVHMVAGARSDSAPRAELVEFTQGTVREVADLGLTLPASE